VGTFKAPPLWVESNVPHVTRLSRQVIGVRGFVFLALIGYVLAAPRPSADEGKRFAGFPRSGRLLGFWLGVPEFPVARWGLGNEVLWNSACLEHVPQPSRWSARMAVSERHWASDSRFS